MRILIGGEREAALKPMSLVITRYGARGQVFGTVSIVGPMRMHYERSIAGVHYVSSLMSGMLEEAGSRPRSGHGTAGTGTRATGGAPEAPNNSADAAELSARVRELEERAQRYMANWQRAQADLQTFVGRWSVTRRRWRSGPPPR